ncbi:minor capsid protein [Clostridium gasigenes]|uniref:minor capsid protein n=1 Tax=Clostridium gasigenes TaxID=94869 RepID=UPI001C0BECC3|nr:minor capsid protein [Clostridium gasigenes]MBU3107142.1 minor capsid protein [Clostridium gasigenes]
MSTIKIEMDSTQKILLKRYLNKNGEAQVRFTKECFKQMNPYIPFLTGRLKDWMIQVNTANITYSAPYARKQYYTNAGNGKQGVSNGGLRGKQWAPRMWVSRGDGIVKTIADFVGGHV